MKRVRQGLLLLWATLVFAGAASAAETLESALQKGLLEEEANHDLPAAIRAYQTAVGTFDQNRRLAATAVFRLAECYRRQGQTNEAQIQYQRIVREFADQTNLVTLSRIQLPASAAVPGTLAQATTAQSDIPEEEQKEIERLKLLLRDSPDLINAQGGVYQWTPLHAAAAKGQIYVARFLLENKAAVNVKSSKDGTTPLHLAAATGNKALVELLLQNGADIQAKNNPDASALASTPLHLAVRQGYLSVAESLLSHGADINAKEITGATVLHYAAMSGGIHMARFLLAHGAKVNAQGSPRPFDYSKNDGRTPLHLACTENVEMVQLLLAAGADVNIHNTDDGVTPLGVAIKSQNPVTAAAIAKLLLEKGAEVNAKQGREGTPLTMAVVRQSTELAKLLLDKGADANAGQADNDTPLAMAATTGNMDMVELLLQHKADVNAVAARGSTALFRAIAKGNLTLVERLLQAGANPDQACFIILKINLSGFPHSGRTGLMQTPLQYAVFQQQHELAALLLKYHADTQLTGNIGGYAPLHIAVVRPDKSLVELLLKHGANPDAATTDGLVPLSLAQTGGNQGPFPIPNMDPMLDRSIDDNYPIYNLPNSWPSINKDDPQMREIAQMLIQHGADPYMQRRKEIALTRHSSREVIFQHDPEGRNYFSLLEVISKKLTTDMILNFGHLTFPDLAHVTINRLGKGNATPQKIPVDVIGLLHSTNAPLDIMLEWGDEVDVPETDHAVGEPWSGLDAELIQAIQQRVQRKVKLVIKGEASEITLSYRLRAAYKANATGPMPGSSVVSLHAPPPPEALRMTIPGVLSTTPYTLPAQLETFWMSEVVKYSRRLRTSSDINHIKVRRIDQTTHHELEMIYDLEPSPNKGSFFYDLWLRDGDVIEIPDKE